jgi:CMP-N-acetylneuraminic acid synthetase
MKILGIITARGGSKRIPGKNIRNFLGKPLLCWSVEAGKESGSLDSFILSTDDESIAKVGRDYGIEVPFMRPKELALDQTPTLPVIVQAVNWLKDNRGFVADWVILLEPSSPGRQPFHIREVRKIIEEKENIDSLIGICELAPPYSPVKALKLLDDKTVVRHDGVKIKDLIHHNQDIPHFYYINSAIYAFNINNLFSKEPSLWGDRVYGYIMDEKFAMDIDDETDWQMAEYKMKHLKNIL